MKEASPEAGGAAYAEISGDIDNDTAVALLDEGNAFLKSSENRELIIDFGQVKSAQSVALSLMIRWLQTAEGQNKVLRFTGLSGKLRDLAGVSGLAEVLPLV